MRISRVKVHNYRNIGGIEILLNPECNYIIGENNLGKILMEVRDELKGNKEVAL